MVLERILKEINAKLESRSALAPLLFNYLMDYKIYWRKRGYSSPLINRFIVREIQKQFGGCFTVMFVGSAPLSYRTEQLIQATLDVNLVQAYGATETIGACHSKKSWDLDYGNVGVPTKFTQFRLENWDEGGYRTTDKPNPRGEIVVGGKTIAEGYYKMKEATDKAFQTDENGVRWYFTGDIGEVLPDGRLKVVDRKNDLTKLANGEYVSLGHVSIISNIKTRLHETKIIILMTIFSFQTDRILPPFSEICGKSLSLHKNFQ